MAAGKTRKKINTKGARSSGGGGGGSTILYGSENPPTIGSDGDYYISSVLGVNIWLRASGSWNLLFSLDTITIDLDNLSTAVVLQNQYYNIVSGSVTILNTAVSHVRVQATGTGAANTAGIFSPKCQAFVTAANKYIDCDYDVATNTLVAILEQEFLIIDDGVTFTITAIKDDFVGKTYTVSYDSGTNDTPYTVETPINTWDSAKTKIIGSSSTDENGDLLISYGFYDNPKKLIIYPYNLFAGAKSDKQKQHGMTFRVITTL